MRHFILTLSFALFLLVGCESTEQKPIITGNTVTGESIGMNGYRLTIPAGFEIYETGTNSNNWAILQLEHYAATYNRSGDSPHYLILVSNNIYLLFMPKNEYVTPDYQRISDMHRQRIPLTFSQMSEPDQINLLNRMMQGINYYGDDYADILTSTEIVDGVPLGISDSLVERNDYTFHHFTINRLGKLHDVYTVIGISWPAWDDTGLNTAKKMLAGLQLD